jgi:DNA-binding transcriptional regulator YiaG
VTPEDLVARRQCHQLSQEKLAAALGVDRVTLARWEAGMRRTPGRMLALALRALELRPSLMDPTKGP